MPCKGKGAIYTFVYVLGAEDWRMRCSACYGPFHPATGHRHTPTMGICARCAGRFFAWVRAHTSKRPSKRHKVSAENFYEAAASSIKAA